MKYSEDFLNKANKLHKNKYDYSLVKYIDSKTKISIICPIHGKFEQRPGDHLNSHGCKLCAKEILRSKVVSNNSDFIKQSKMIHGDKYDYSKVEYVNNHTKVIVVCPKHGEFKQLPTAHKQGKGCPKCADKSYTTKSFIEKSEETHRNKYDYSKVDYKNSHSKVIIMCPEHGEFEQKASHHLSGQGCKKCAHKNYTLTKKQFVKKAKEIHGDKYDYSKVEYINKSTKVKIMCPTHGEFEQTPKSHLKNHGCQKCSKNHNPTTKEFIKKAKEIHGDKYDYSKSKYKNTTEDVIIICPNHGEFKQNARRHLKGKGCLQCAIDSLYGTTESFIADAEEIHDNKYDYSKVNYKNSKTKVTIICPKHGEFEQIPKNHISNKNGCPRCAQEITISSGHQEIIDFIRSISDAELKTNDREAIKPHELDIYLPEHKFAIEYHGLYWHSYDRNEITEERNKHKNKHQLCLDKSIKLFQIFENEWSDTKTRKILKSKIRVILGLGNKIYARKCNIKNLNNKEYSDFMNKYHLQASKGSSVKLGLFYKDELVSAMSFNKHPKHEWEITRFANKLDTIVVGGASRLFKYFVKTHNPQQVMTYADRRYSDGNLYKKLGFELDGVTQPNYFYIKSGNVFSRQQFQKHKLEKKLDEFDSILTESQNMFNNGYRRIWDAGHFRFIQKWATIISSRPNHVPNLLL